MILDFRNCKTPQDVDKVFSGHKKEFSKIRKIINDATKLSTLKEKAK